MDNTHPPLPLIIIACPTTPSLALSQSPATVLFVPIRYAQSFVMDIAKYNNLPSTSQSFAKQMLSCEEKEQTWWCVGRGGIVLGMCVHDRRRVEVTIAEIAIVLVFDFWFFAVGAHNIPGIMHLCRMMLLWEGFMCIMVGLYMFQVNTMLHSTQYHIYIEGKQCFSWAQSPFKGQGQGSYNP